jgi:CheY-like chemotaxis protein
MARIVVADDDVDVRTLVVLKLESVGHEVIGVENGVEALEQCREVLPDLVVLDLMMPAMSGLEACREIRADPETADLPVILLTARAQDHDVLAGRSVGADAYLTKPFSPRDLAHQVHVILEGSAR